MTSSGFYGFVLHPGGLTEASCLQDVLLSHLRRKHQFPRRSRHGVVRHLDRLFRLYHRAMQAPTQVSFDLRQSIVRFRQQQCNSIQRKLCRYHLCVSMRPLCRRWQYPQLYSRCVGLCRRRSDLPRTLHRTAAGFRFVILSFEASFISELS